MLEKEFQYFIQHQDELVEKYPGKFLVIVGDQVQGTYDTEYEAYVEAQKEHELGTFLIQQAISGEDAYTVTYHSRVVVA